MTIDKKILSGFAITLAIFLLMGFLCYRSTLKLIDTTQWVTHTHEVLEKLETLLSRMKDIETGQRGYLLTGQASYLDPYHDAMRDLENIKTALRALTVDNPRQQQLLDKLYPTVSASVEFSEQIIKSHKAGGKEGLTNAVALIKSEQGKKLMDRVRSLVKDCEEEEYRLLIERKAEAETSSVLALYTIIIGNALAALVVGVGGYVVVRSITVPVRQAVQQLSAASAELVASTTEQAAGAQEQAAAVAQTVTTIDEVGQTADQAAQRAKSVGEAMQRNLEIGKVGKKAIEDSLAGKQRVKEQIEATAESILGLAEQAQTIGEIIATVNDIAEQINLLALNAAIEASRAGEHGRGFSVVAGEIKALADQSKKATVQIRQSLGEIQKATNTTVLSTEEVTRGVASAIQLGGQAGTAITGLTQALSETAKVAAQIVASAGQQATGMSQIRQAMRNIDQVAKQQAAATRQATQAAENLNVLGGQLARLIAQ